MVKVMLVLFQMYKRNLIFLMLLICVALFLSCSSSRADVVESEDPTDVDGSSIAVQISGIISDPYIAGATVCCDSNNNDQCDINEVSVISDQDGYYELTDECSYNDTLLALGGVDVVTGELNIIQKSIYLRNLDMVNINPITSILSYFDDYEQIVILK